MWKTLQYNVDSLVKKAGELVLYTPHSQKLSQTQQFYPHINKLTPLKTSPSLATSAVVHISTPLIVVTN